MRQLLGQAREIEGGGARLQLDQLLRPEGREYGAHFGARTGLHEGAAKLEALEGAAEHERHAEREALVLEPKAPLCRDARRRAGAERQVREAHIARAVGRLGALDAQALDLELTDAHAEGHDEWAARAAAAFADGHVERADLERL